MSRDSNGETLFVIGDSTIRKIHEMDLNGFTLAELLPAMNERLPDLHPEWLPAGTMAGRRALLSIHSWLVYHRGLTILIDTGAGNDKTRPQQKVLDHLRNPFLERLSGAGVSPETIDYVLHTHIHSDHVGWNTRLVDDEWVPTFPNAKHICSRLEWNYGESLADGDEQRIASARAEAGLGEPVRIPVTGTFNDSMRPLQTSGQIKLIEVDGQEILPGVRYIPTPGHSIEHAAIELESNGKRAIFGGDVMHHPVELYDIDLVSVFCEFPDAARRSRRYLLERAVELDALYLSAHFPLSSAGRVTEKDGAFTWTFQTGP